MDEEDLCEFIDCREAVKEDVEVEECCCMDEGGGEYATLEVEA